MEHSYIDEYSRIKSFIHNLEPRIKLISFFALIVSIIFTRPAAMPAFGAYAMLIFLLVFLSKIPLMLVLSRSFSVIPFILIMSIFIIFIKPGEPVWEFSLGIFKLSITNEGLAMFLNIAAKAYLCSLSMLLLMLSTNFLNLLKALEKLRVPSILIMIISFMYRYLFVLEDELMKMRRAKDSRTIAGSRWFHARALANMLGVLFVRAYERAEDVYLAMCARGFDGGIRTIYDYKLRIKDLCFLATAVSAVSIIKIYIG